MRVHSRPVRDERRPQVLVLDVDKPAGAREHLPIGVGDAAFAERRERVPAQPRRVGTQHLHGVRTGRCRFRLRIRQVPTDQLAGVIRPVDQHPHRAGEIENGAPVPTLAEGAFEIGYHRSLHSGLDVVPRRTVTVGVREVHGLRVTAVSSVIVPAATEVDAAEERDVLLVTVGKAQDDELLMVGACAPRTGVKQHLTAGLREHARQLGILTFALVEPARLGAPDQPEDEHAALGQFGQDLTDRRSRPGKQLLCVAAKVREVQLVMGAHAAEDVVQSGEVLSAVDQGLDQISGGPVADVRSRVTTLAIREKPSMEAGVFIA